MSETGEKTARRIRRPRGKGGLVWRDPYWYIVLTHQEKRHQVSSKCDRRADALTLLDKCNAAIKEGTFTSVADVRDPPPPTPAPAVETVADVAAKWLERYVKAERDAKGYVLAKSRVATYLVPCLGTNEAFRLTTDDLRDYGQWLKQQKIVKPLPDGTGKQTDRLLTTQTVKHYLSDLRCMVLWAEERKLFQRIWPKKLLPKVPKKKLRSLEADQQEAVRAVVNPYGFAIRIMLDSGVRWSELCRLTRDDLVDNSLVVCGETKSGEMRTVPIPPALVAEIRGHVGKLVPYEQKDNGWFNVAVRKKSGVAAFSAHSCRHSYGFNYMARGGQLLALKEHMGHSTVELTASYARPSESHAHQDAEKTFARSAAL